MTALRFFMLLALVIWIGGILFFSAVVAPAVFGVLPTRHLAGLVVNRSLTALHWIGIVSGGIFLILSVFLSYHSGAGWQALAPRNVLVFCMIVVTLFSQLVVSTKMAALRAQMGDIDNVPVNDARRVAFNSLHQWSTSLEVIVLILGLITLWVVARHWAIPFSTTGVTENLPPHSSSAFHS